MKLSPKRANALVDKWRLRLVPDARWTFTVRVIEDAQSVPEELRNHRGWSEFDEYFQAHIYFNAYNLANEKEANALACHEVTHVALNAITHVVDSALGEGQSTLATLLVENAVETISCALVALE